MLISSIEYLNKYGLPWRRASSLPSGEHSPTWNGQCLTIEWNQEDDSSFSSVEWVIHEISHYLFAPETSRILPNYGLGSDPGGGSYVSKIKGASRGKNSAEDEGAVCILDLILMLEEKISEQFIRRHAENYCIQNLNENDFKLLAQIGIDSDRIERVRPFLYDEF